MPVIELSTVRTALIALLKDVFADSDPKPQIDAITVKDVNDASNLIRTPPAVLLFYEGRQHNPARDTTRLTYQPLQTWGVLIGARSLRSPQEEQAQVLAMLDVAAAGLAGVRLTLGAADDGSGGYNTEPITLVGDNLAQMDENGTWYQLDFTLGGVSQYSRS